MIPERRIGKPTREESGQGESQDGPKPPMASSLSASWMHASSIDDSLQPSSHCPSARSFFSLDQETASTIRLMRCPCSSEMSGTSTSPPAGEQTTSEEKKGARTEDVVALGEYFAAQA